MCLQALLTARFGPARWLHFGDDTRGGDEQRFGNLFKRPAINALRRLPACLKSNYTCPLTQFSIGETADTLLALEQESCLSK
jgi:hypothetical protein